MKLICFEDAENNKIFVDANRIVAIAPHPSGSALVVEAGSGTETIEIATDSEELASLIERFVPHVEVIYLR